MLKRVDKRGYISLIQVVILILGVVAVGYALGSDIGFVSF